MDEKELYLRHRSLEISHLRSCSLTLRGKFLNAVWHGYTELVREWAQQDEALPVSRWAVRRAIRSARNWEAYEKSRGYEAGGTESIKIMCDAIASKWTDREELRLTFSGARDASIAHGRQDLAEYFEGKLQKLQDPHL